MSNSPATPYNSTGYQQINSNPTPPINHSKQYQSMPLIQGNVIGLKQDSNSNSPLRVSTPIASPQMGPSYNVSYAQNSNSSPAFDNSTMIQSQQGSSQASPHRPPPTSVPLSASTSYYYTNNHNNPHSSVSHINAPNTSIPSTSYGIHQGGQTSGLVPQQIGQINSNAPSLVSSIRPPMGHHLMNGPPVPPQKATPLQAQSVRGPPPPTSVPDVYNRPYLNQSPIGLQQGSVGNYSTSSNSSMKPVSLSGIQNVPSSIRSPINSHSGFQTELIASTTSSNNVPISQANKYVGSQNVPLNTIQDGSQAQASGPLNTAFTSAAFVTSPNLQIGPPIIAPQLPTYNNANIGPPVSSSIRPPLSGPLTGLSVSSSPSIPMSNPMQPSSNRPPLGITSSPVRPQLPGPPVGPPANPAFGTGVSANIPQTGRSFDSSLTGPPINQLPPTNSLPSNSQIPRYPSTSPSQRYPTNMPPSSYVNNQPRMMDTSRQYPTQQNTQDITQRMGQLSVTKQGFDQLWGHQMVDLLQCRHVLPEYPEDPPDIKLGPHFADAPNCSPDIFRCTINRIPETNSLLQKSRLPLGILIHPFKDLNHLPVIQCNTIVRCRSCRTYINPFVYFVDSKRWKCNLCYRVNDLPEEFQYDPVSKSYGDPSRRPEIKSATIEFIAPGEYMLRPPQPAVYLFLLDVSQIARDSGYLEVFCEILKENLTQLPGDARTQVGFVCFDSHVHYYLMSDGLTRPKEMTVLDIDDVFLPSPESLLVNLNERRELVMELLSVLPKRHSGLSSPASALGAALQAGYKLMAPTGGRITVFQTCLPNAGPGALTPREDPNARSSKDVAHLNPATDFYKRLALDCSGAQIAVDLFLLNSQYSDLATLSGMSKFSGGSVYHIPLFKASRSWQADQLKRMLTRYLTRKIGFEAVMRVRCTRGITIHTFHGNFFVRSTDLLSLPNVSPDAGFGMQLAIEESLSDLQQVCFQAALLYTSSKGERRIRVHTLALPIATTLPDVLHNADQQCIIGLLAKMAVDRCASASMAEAREALMNVAVDALSAHRLAQNLPVGERSTGLFAPASLRLLPLYLLALLKRRAFRTGTSTRLDDRVADMCHMKTLPLSQLLRAVYPDLYPIHALAEHLPAPADEKTEEEEDPAPDPPRQHLSAERINSTGAYLLDDGETMIVYVGHAVSPAFLSDTFGVASFNQVQDEARVLPKVDSEGNALLHAFIDRLNDDRPYPSNILVLRDNSPSRQLFTERMVDDRVESAFAYYEFLQHVKTQVK